jgi:hypothetical protein
MNKLPQYPADHQVGMEVPEGGSNCDKCKHLSAPQTCDDGEFITWNGSDHIPTATSRYCCDFFKMPEAKKGSSFGRRLGGA